MNTARTEKRKQLGALSVTIISSSPGTCRVTPVKDSCTSYTCSRWQSSTRGEIELTGGNRRMIFGEFLASSLVSEGRQPLSQLYRAIMGYPGAILTYYIYVRRFF